MPQLTIKILTGLFILIAQISLAQTQPQIKLIPADNPALKISGRAKVENGTAFYNWPGVSIETHFTGKQLGVELKGGPKNYFDVWVDKKPAQILRAVNDTVWWYPEPLSAGKHLLKIVKRTEGEMGMAAFRGIRISSNAKVENPKTAKRKLLFIGNSITCGYGTEGLSATEHFKPATENCEKSYATIVARALNAEYQLVSHSGIGLVHNYGDKKQISTDLPTMPVRFDYLFDNDSTQNYDLRNYIPDAVFINLGTNDYSTQPHPNNNVFIAEGIKLIKRLRELYPNAKVFCITGPMIHEPVYSNMNTIVEQAKAELNTEDIYFIGMNEKLLNEPQDLGSDYHPSYIGQTKSAKVILPVVKKATGWRYSKKEISHLLK